VAAYPWSTGDANAARSAQFRGERCAQAASGCHWVKASFLALARLGSAVSMEMMLVEMLPGCHGRMPREPYRPRSGRLGAVDLSGWLWLFAFGGTAPSRLRKIPHRPLTPSTRRADAT
jgi:hypothetical protein